MADFTINFDTPKSSSITTVRVIGTVPGDKTQGYVRIKVTASNTVRHDIYYKTIPITPTSSTYQFTGTYDVAIVPKLAGTLIPSAGYAFSFTAQV